MTTSSALHMPMQVAPIHRVGIPGAVADGSGIEAAGIFDDILNGVTKATDVVQKVGSVAMPLLSSFGI